MKNRIATIGLLAVVMTGMLALVQAGKAGAAAPQKDITAAYTIAAQDHLGTDGYNCLLYYNGLVASPSATELQLVYVDAVLAEPAAPCNQTYPQAYAATPNAVEGGSTPTPGAHLNDGVCNGNYSTLWNINGHFSSSWMNSAWGALGCWAEVPAGWPQCWPGDSTWPFSVQEYGCNAINNPGIFVTTIRNVFIVHYDVDLLVIHVHSTHTYWFWENLYVNGAVEQGCHVGFC